ncbi:hypothetical protein [Kozakia baliensis]|uniref:Uncharacterized protein n=1 Tax=Kozakia baliensis TaxID=153496 RepID=A0A1D8UTE3_9PROT|nr:hypothetical protein [Kozakia baliensis]AOX16924.1 hypothetical protein A0U89_07000 [Kozakia baliensis]GBR25570.1 hypothetical protein AA0488_0685 [Kozakia baliensis NRIC 0488]GEL64028.1 hypothetical protein KBA01_13140 [Kozakia baliensis]
MAEDSRLQIEIPSYALEFSKKNLRKSLRIAGNEVARTARSEIRNSIGGGRLYYGPGGSIQYRGGAASGRHRASSPGEAPANETGTLARSIKVVVLRNKDAIGVRDAAFYAKMLEAGAKGGAPGRKNQRNRGQIYASGGRVLEPRPFLSKALAERAPSIQRRLADAAIKDVVMERVKK